jgi:hypothetical protein
MGLSQLGSDSLDCHSWGYIHWTVTVGVRFIGTAKFVVRFTRRSQLGLDSLDCQSWS